MSCALHQSRGISSLWGAGLLCGVQVIKYLFNCDNVDMLDDSWVEARSSERICNIIKELRRQRYAVSALEVSWE